MEYLDSPEDLALSNLRLYEKLVRPYRRYMDEKVKVHVLTAGLFVSAFNPIVDGKNRRSHPNGPLNCRFYRPPILTKAPAQRAGRFPQKRHWTRLPGNRKNFSPLYPSSVSHSHRNRAILPFHVKLFLAHICIILNTCFDV